MFVNGVKITLIICLTIIVSAVLTISYSEYASRYTITSAGDNSIYIFDKKSAVLNKCSEKGCEVIETKLPENVNLGFSPFSPSRMFGNDQNMRNAIVKAEATSKNVESEKEQQLKAPEAEKDADIKKSSEDRSSEDKINSQQKTEEKQNEENEEFIE